MRAGKQAKEEKERALREARRAAALVVAKPTVEHYPFSDQPNRIVVGTTANYLYGSQYARGRVRYPGATAWAAYQDVQAQIQKLTATAQRLLEQAYDTGSPIPDADVKAVGQAIAAVPQP